MKTLQIVLAIAILSVLVLSQIESYAQEGWTLIDPLGEGTLSLKVHLRDVHAFDRNTVIAVGDGGTVIKSLNGGISWDIYRIGGINLYEIHFIDDSIGWLVGDRGSIRKTIDGGDTWSIQDSRTVVDLRSVFIRSPLLNHTSCQ